MLEFNTCTKPSLFFFSIFFSRFDSCGSVFYRKFGFFLRHSPLCYLSPNLNCIAWHCFFLSIYLYLSSSTLPRCNILFHRLSSTSHSHPPMAVFLHPSTILLLSPDSTPLDLIHKKQKTLFSFKLKSSQQCLMRQNQSELPLLKYGKVTGIYQRRHHPLT